MHKDPSAEVVRLRLNFNGESGHVQTTHKMRDIKRKLPEHGIDCGFWSSCSATRTVLEKPCWLELKADADACGTSEPTIQNILRRAKDPRTRPGYGNITLGPGGPLPWPVLAMPGGAHMCMRSWRGSYVERNAVSFQQCPQERTRGLHRWGGTQFFAWKLQLDGADGSVETSYPQPERVVRIQPQQAPHMCLTAPTLADSDEPDAEPDNERAPTTAQRPRGGRPNGARAKGKGRGAHARGRANGVRAKSVRSKEKGERSSRKRDGQRHGRAATESAGAE